MPPLGTNSAFILEEPLIRTPYELLRRSHRSAQRQVERDFTFIQASLQNLLKGPGLAGDDKGKTATATAVLAKLDQTAERVKGLKRKPSESQPSPLRARLGHLGAGAGAGAREGSGRTTTLPPAEIVLDRYIVDYLLRTGRMKAAQALIDKHGLELLVDDKLFAELIRVERALVDKQSVAEALAWCGENRGTLKKTKNNLEFTLRLQEYIELCRARRIQDAIAYSRKHLAQWAPTYMAEIQRAMTLLAFGEKTGVGSYRGLYDRSRWHTVRTHFRETFLTLYALPSQPLLSLALSAGLTALRLPSCAPYIDDTDIDAGMGIDGAGDGASETTPRSPVIPLLPAAPPRHNLEGTLFPDRSAHLTAPVGGVRTGSPAEELHDHPELPTGNVDCPTCGPELKVLASECPMSHHTNSTIVCRISGRVMDSENEPMSFPNGYVYSAKALQEMAKNSFDVVTCPRTRETCAFSRLRKVYIS